MDDLEQVIRNNDLMPPDAELKPLGQREYGLRLAGMAEFVRVTTNPTYFEANAESVELWSPGSPVFRAPEGLAEFEATAETLRNILGGDGEG